MDKKDLLENIQDYTPKEIAAAINAGVVTFYELRSGTHGQFTPLLQRHVKTILELGESGNPENKQDEKKISGSGLKWLAAFVDIFSRKDTWVKILMWMSVLMMVGVAVLVLLYPLTDGFHRLYSDVSRIDDEFTLVVLILLSSTFLLESIAIILQAKRVWVRWVLGIVATIILAVQICTIVFIMEHWYCYFNFFGMDWILPTYGVPIVIAGLAFLFSKRYGFVRWVDFAAALVLLASLVMWFVVYYEPKPSATITRMYNGDIVVSVDGVDFTMKWVEGGTFDVVGDDGESLYEVEIPDYWIAETEVTQALWEKLALKNPSAFRGDDSNLPVENVEHCDCDDFCRKLNALLFGMDSWKVWENSFRLPSEEEWKYAARGGKRNDSYRYAGSNIIDHVAWYKDNSSDNTHPVKSKQPNALGLYDMSGNVREWCEYVDVCGGSWASDANDCRISSQIPHSSHERDSETGFRLVYNEY